MISPYGSLAADPFESERVAHGLVLERRLPLAAHSGFQTHDHKHSSDKRRKERLEVPDHGEIKVCLALWRWEQERLSTQCAVYA